MKTLRKSLSILLSLMLVFGTFAAGGMTASADTYIRADGVEYSLSDGNATVTGISDDLSIDLVIPESVTVDGLEYDVIEIGDSAFMSKSITGITLPESLVSVGDRAFKNCSNLSYVEFGTGITTIGNEAFNSCTNLDKVVLPLHVVSIGYGAFSGTTNLTDAFASAMIDLSAIGFGSAANIWRYEVLADQSGAPAGKISVKITGRDQGFASQLSYDAMGDKYIIDSVEVFGVNYIAPPPVYTVTLDPGEGSGEPLVFRSSDQTEFPNWQNSENLHFYLEDDGRMGFRLDTDYCPDTFIAPDDDFSFDKWSEDYTYHTLSSTDTVITALWNSNGFLIIGVNDVELDWDNYNAFCSFRPREAGTYAFYSNYPPVNLVVTFDGKTYDDPYDNVFRFSTYLEANEVFSFEVKADEEYPEPISVTVASDVASYSLTPAEYTIENSGYSDITCSFDSLYLGPIVNEYGNIENAYCLQFYLNGGTLTDGNGNSIPFLVDEQWHLGASDRSSGYEYSSPDETVIMSVWIDPEVYDAAAPGTYTGELVYDGSWYPSYFQGASGSIALTLVIPDPFESVETYTDWEGTLVIDESKAVIISGATHDNTGTAYGSAIKICNNSTVDLYFDGANVLSANPDIISAGIEVEEGSTVNIYGLDGSSLTATGGKYSAGIGGIGYGSVSATNPKAGNINIYSGTIVATGGDKGAGIGSGYHSSAGNINIYGGDITAIGKGFGAGIGSGYGTSGGSATSSSGYSTGAGVGFYNGGNITISGGTVRATASADENFSFDSFDIFDSSTYPREDSFAAGIGGGYGASSGNIIIEGNAVVTAIGSCGGAGIGTGRGTTKEAYYDADNFDCNVIIRGNAVVTALATADSRTSVLGDDGGAAIGLGRGCTISGQPKGTISISENAEVTALAECWANAIGSGCAVGKFTKDAEGNIKRPVRALMESVEIADTAVIHAYSDGNRASVFEVTYTDWEGTLVIDESKSVAISGVTHDNNGTGYASAIKICNNSTVDLYIEGVNVLSGNPDVISAGIEVEEGSTVNLYALDENSSLTATGGKYSAGIGGIGYGSVSATNPKAGNINIYSGTIVATGGDKGAGIGSGYHSSAGDINIYGGDITAIGTGCGAGIGSGFGTSGGAAVAAGVGFYNGGNITISGGTVRATASDDGNFSFDSFDIFNSETYPRGNTFAAGIGGGYGASSGNIVIEGDADVTAIGCCGGAGIGTGRGTTKLANYDADHFDCNVIIRGNAKVIALATADLRENITGDDGGAAIGLGRHCAIVGQPVGTISISENAEVTALAECWANAIGSGCALGKFTKDADGNITRPEMAQMESVDIDDIAAVHAYSDGNRGPYYEEFPYIMIAFLDTDDNILQIGKYGWHAVPELNFEAPSKPMTDQFTYPLTGWDDGNGNVCPADAITPAEVDVTYTPVFTETSRFTPTISATEVVRGDKLTWNIAGPLNVTWLKFNGTDENGNIYTSYYKYSNYNKGTTEASVIDGAEERVWNIPMVFNYAGTQAVDIQTWSIEFRVSGSSEWQAVPGDAFNIKVGKNAEAIAPAPEGGESEPYSICESYYTHTDENGTDYIYFIIQTTDDVSKVKISFVNADTGKTKSATYQVTSTNVLSYYNSGGKTIWVIRMKNTAPALNNEYTAQVRGAAWGEGTIVPESNPVVS